MTVKKILSESNTIILACSECNRQKTVDMTPYLEDKPSTKFKVTCKCGHSWSVDIERRRHTRKSANLPGDFVVYREGEIVDSGHILVVDISLGGLKIKLNRKKDLQVGDALEVDFKLDNKHQTHIKRRIHIEYLDFPFVGTVYEKKDRLDPDIGFYLQEKKS